MADSITAVYEALRRQVGGVARRKLGVLRRRDFERFAVASGDANPLFFDDTFARTAGYPGAIAPPLYLSSVMGWEAGPPLEALMADGTTGAELPALALAGLRLMGGGQELRFHRPVLDGIEATMEVGVESVELKEGGSGPFLLMRLCRRYLDADGRELVTCRETFIAR